MRKNLLTAMALAGSVFASPLLTTSVANARENPKENPTDNSEIQELYPNLREDEMVSIELTKNREGLSVVNVQYDIRKNDGIGDIQYSYRVKRKIKNFMTLANPFSVTIDKDGDPVLNEYETTYLNGKTSEKLRKSPSVNTQGSLPVLRGDYLDSIDFGPFPEKEGFFAFIQYATTNNRSENIVYSHKIICTTNNKILLETPSHVFFDKDGDGVFGFNSEEMFSLEKKPIEYFVPKREFEI